VGTEDQEIVERSEGGYRTKRKVIPGTAPDAPQKDPGCKALLGVFFLLNINKLFGHCWFIL